jgi:competence protein ComEA
MFSKHAVHALVSFLSTCLIIALMTLPACNAAHSKQIIITTRNVTFTGNIFIAGAVNNPGLYPFAQGDSLDDLVQSAGGLKNGADLASVTLTIPDPVSVVGIQRIDINRAEAWLLAALPGIGDTHARDIVTYREQNGVFRNVSGLLQVKGIGQSTLDKIRDMVTVSDKS